VHVPYREVIVAKEHRFELEKAASETTDEQSNNKRGKKGRQKTKCEIPVQRPLERNYYKGEQQAEGSTGLGERGEHQATCGDSGRAQIILTISSSSCSRPFQLDEVLSSPLITRGVTFEISLDTGGD